MHSSWFLHGRDLALIFLLKSHILYYWHLLEPSLLYAYVSVISLFKMKRTYDRGEHTKCESRKESRGMVYAKCKSGTLRMQMKNINILCPMCNEFYHILMVQR
jgi:hypothetical protein